MTDTEKYSKQIQDTASQILKDTNLISILSEFGEVILDGSYKYGLMWGCDIDIIVKCDNPRESSVGALQKLIDLRLFQKYEYGDFVKFKREHRPESYIVNLRLPYAEQKWEIEVWFFTEIPTGHMEVTNLVETKLNDENKKIILEMKRMRDEVGDTKFDISSTTIYKRVLQDGIKNFNEL